ncbi:MAG: bifunctional phosphoribosylaminoimidazolecarboxamide formyltransferase/IMP cyclohydrolase, partial [Leptospiraceae bacterium]|nr:bifunctional phosphoribosylaminoimidazolecarboxamide formyltransferase/IMP cyclohydrolase [Leptospiraceae bacterium]
MERALLSVSDKTGLVDFARFLHEQSVELISTGGTLKALKDAGVPATAIEDYTGFPEMMGGRVKTLHPRIHGGILAMRENETHLAAMREHDIPPIDMVIVNLYPFAATIAREDVQFPEAVEMIDIGGPTLLRAAAKNHAHTVVVCDPADYNRIQTQMQAGDITADLKRELAGKVFNHTAAYDAMIAGYFNEQADNRFPENLTLTYRRVQSLRYGENPHQQAAFYRPALDMEKEKRRNLQGIEQLQGKELSFNNLLDTGAAVRCVMSLPRPGAVIIKHLNPCGAAVVADSKLTFKDALKDTELNDAFLRARACDPVSAFGGIIAVPTELDEETARSIAENFAEVVVAPAFSAGALEVLGAKKNLRLLRIQDAARFFKQVQEVRSIPGGVLYQDYDFTIAPQSDWKVVTEKQPDAETLHPCRSGAGAAFAGCG